MEPRKTFTQTELHVIASYRIPVEEVADIEYMECRYVGGGSTYILTTLDGEKGWHGCGHLRCEQCQYASAEGIVGDDATRKYHTGGLRRRTRKMECGYCKDGVPHAPHTCGRVDKPPEERGIGGSLVNHWWTFSFCGAKADEPCRYSYPTYCLTHGPSEH